jgi:hypothetical protein
MVLWALMKKIFRPLYQLIVGKTGQLVLPFSIAERIGLINH